jgi:hypothetical protein
LTRTVADVVHNATPGMFRYKRLKMEKRALQVRLHAFQEEFMKQKGRGIQTAEDCEPVANEYKRYKVLPREWI